MKGLPTTDTTSSLQKTRTAFESLPWVSSSFQGSSRGNMKDPPCPCTLRGWRPWWFPGTGWSRWAPPRPTGGGAGGWRPSSCRLRWTHSTACGTLCWRKNTGVRGISSSRSQLLPSNLEGTSVAESKTFWEISQPPVREGGGSVGGGGLQNSQIRYYEAVSGVVNTFHVMRISQ